jgi:hypothetical protein
VRLVCFHLFKSNAALAHGGTPLPTRASHWALHTAISLNISHRTPPPPPPPHPSTIFNGNGKLPAELELAVSHGVLVNIDSEFDLANISAAAKKVGKAARVSRWGRGPRWAALRRRRRPLPAEAAAAVSSPACRPRWACANPRPPRLGPRLPPAPPGPRPPTHPPTHPTPPARA